MTMDNHAARKAAVYEAALQLVARGVSPAAMTIQQLADTAGIGKGTVYGYFSSKERSCRAWLNTALPGKSSASASCLPTAARWPGWRSGQ